MMGINGTNQGSEEFWNVHSKDISSDDVIISSESDVWFNGGWFNGGHLSRVERVSYFGPPFPLFSLFPSSHPPLSIFLFFSLLYLAPASFSKILIPSPPRSSLIDDE